MGLVVVAMMGGLAGGAYWLYKKGKRRDTIAHKVQRALRSKNYEKAAELARQMLAKDPDNPDVFDLLLDTLVQAEKYDEAEAEANKRLDDPKLGDRPRRALCAIAVQRGELGKADRIARTLADTSPPFAHRVLALIQDQRGILNSNPMQRLAAANTMRDLASVTDEDATRVHALLFSASVTLEVTLGIETAEHFVRQARTDLKTALSAADKAHQVNRQFPLDYVVARIRILSEKVKDSEMGAETLRDFTSADKRDSAAVAELILYHARLGDRVEVLDLIRDLKDPYRWYRVMWVLQRRWPKLALEVLEQRDPKNTEAIHVLMRAGLLLRKNNENAKKDIPQATELIKALARDPKVETSVIVGALQMLAIRGGIDVARGVATETNLAERKDQRLTALLAVLLNANEDDRERAEALVRELAANADPETEGLVLRLLGQGGQLVESYFDAQIEKGGGSAMKYRLTRALANLARASREKDTGRAESMRKKVTRDLRVVLDDPDANRRALLDGFWLAASLGDSDLAGKLLGLALVRPGRPAMLAVRILEIAFKTEDRETVAAIAKGVESIAPKTDTPAFLRAFARIFSDKVDEASIDEFEKAAEADSGAPEQSLEIACRIALGHGKLDRAEALARRIMKAAPERIEARELLGAALLQQKQAEATVALWTAIEKPSEAGYRQLIGAYMILEKTDKAKSVAETAVETYPQAPGPYVMLATIYEQREEFSKALSILNLAPPVPFVTLKRATYLVKLEQLPAAEQLFLALLDSAKFKDRIAWAGLSSVMLLQKRGPEFIELTSSVLMRKLVKDPHSLALIHFLRGETLERGGQVSQALGEYERAIEHNEDFWMALNNAAWHMAKLQKARAKDAQRYIDKALELQPENAAVLDTAAEVYAVLKDFGKSIELINRALAACADVKRPDFLLHKAELHLRAEQLVEARKAAQAILDNEEWAKHPKAKKARSIIAELDRNND